MRVSPGNLRLNQSCVVQFIRDLQIPDTDAVAIQIVSDGPLTSSACSLQIAISPLIQRKVG